MRGWPTSANLSNRRRPRDWCSRSSSALACQDTRWHRQNHTESDEGEISRKQKVRGLHRALRIFACERRTQKSMPPMTPPGGMPPPPAFFFGSSATMAAVVISSAATLPRSLTTDRTRYLRSERRCEHMIALRRQMLAIGLVGQPMQHAVFEHDHRDASGGEAAPNIGGAIRPALAPIVAAGL